MGAPFIPADPGTLPAEEVPSKVFTVEQANGLLPSLEQVFREMDRRSLRLREVLELVQDAEEYWGERVVDSELPERSTYLALAQERDDLQASLREDIARVHSLGAVLKDYQQGLVDFYGVVEGRIVFLCWQRGEPSVRYYHTLESGFAGRRPLTAVAQK